MMDIKVIKRILAVDTIIPLGKDIHVGWWYKNPKTGFAYRIVEADGGLLVKESRKSSGMDGKKPSTWTPEKKLRSRKHKVKWTTIKCKKCGALRDTVVWNVHSVTLCRECQRKLLNKKRVANQRRKDARAKVQGSI